MGLPTKGNPAGAYGRLLAIYPAKYRQDYGQPMVQTFYDMLQDEPSRFRRALVWARALVDLPISATKEHLTDGKDLTMNRKMKYLFTSIVALLILANGASWWFGNLHARQTSGVEKVTAAQLADAMQNDNFYATYGDSAVLFEARVANVKTQGNTSLVTFAAGRPYSVVCQFPDSPAIKVGQTLSVAAPAGSAERQSHGVLLHNCLEN